jgi:hypothetical protein
VRCVVDVRGAVLGDEHARRVIGDEHRRRIVGDREAIVERSRGAEG